MHIKRFNFFLKSAIPCGIIRSEGLFGIYDHR